MTDAEAVHQIRSGNDDPFAQLVGRYAGCVWAVCLDRVYNRSECEDVVQEVFLQAYLKLDRLREPAAFGAWLGRIARTKCLEWSRAQGRRADALRRRAENEEEGTMESPRDALEREERQRAVREALDALPVTYRETLRLYYLAGQTTDEAAAILGITPEALRKRLELGRKQLRIHVEEELAGALAEDRPPERLRALILAAIPLGQAPWHHLASPATPQAGRILGSTAMKITAIAATALVAGFATLYAVHPWSTPTTAAAPNVEAIAPSPTVLAEVEPVPPPMEPAPDPIPSVVEEVDTEVAAIPLQALPDLHAQIDEALNKRISIDFEDTHVAEVLSFIGDYLKTNMVLDPRAVQVPREPDADAAILALSRSDIETLLLPAPSMRAFIPPEMKSKGQAQVAELHAAVQQGQVPPLLKAIVGEYLSKAQAPRKQPTDALPGIVETIDVQGITAGEALHQLCKPLGLEAVVEPGYVWISTRERIGQEVRPYPDAEYQTYDTEECLQETVSLQFADVSIYEVADYLSDYIDANIVVDWRAVAKDPRLPSLIGPGISMPSLPDGAPGEILREQLRQREAVIQRALSAQVPPAAQANAVDAKVGLINLQNVQLRHFLTAVLRPLNLTWTAKNGYIWVTSATPSAQDKPKGTGLPRIAGAEWLKPIEEITLQDTTLRDALRANATPSVDIRIDAEALDLLAQQHVTLVSLHNAPAWLLLDMLLRPTDLAWTWRDGAVYIARPERLSAPDTAFVPIEPVPTS